MSNDSHLFEKFRYQQVLEKKATDRNAAKFIFRGSMATRIVLDDTEYQVGFVYDNREEEDKAYLYVLKPDAFNIGNTFTWTDSNEVDHHYIIYDEEKSVKHVKYNKYLCFECNVELDGLWGFLSGPRSTYINTQLRQMLYEVSLAKPVLIMGADSYAIADILEFGERYWRIIEKDNYSVSGIVYYYLEQYVKQKTVEEVVDSFEDEVQADDELRPGEEVVLPTEEGYFEADVELQTLITPDSVTFIVPFDVTELHVVYKTDGLLKTKAYKVVM